MCRQSAQIRMQAARAELHADMGQNCMQTWSRVCMQVASTKLHADVQQSMDAGSQQRQRADLTGLPNPMEAVAVLSETCVSSPLKAPPTMKRMSLVSRGTVSPRGFLRPPFSGTFTVVPSSILRRACCTPSPLTSLVMLRSLSFTTILSICSITTTLSRLAYVCCTGSHWQFTEPSKEAESAAALPQHDKPAAMLQHCHNAVNLQH